MKNRPIPRVAAERLIVPVLFGAALLILAPAGRVEGKPALKRAPTVYVYEAVTEKTAHKQGMVTAGKLRWRCKGSKCVIRGPWPSPGVAACHQLAEQVGRVRSYGRRGRTLNRMQLAQCNKGIKAPMLKLHLPPGGVQGPAGPSLRVRAPSGASPSSGTGTSASGPWRITTPQIRAVARGASLSTGGSFSLALSVPTIRAVAMGAPLTAPAREPIAITTPTIRAVATGTLPGG